VAAAALRAAPNGVDVLVSNAGLGWAGPVTEMTAAKTAELVAVNLTAPMQLTRLLLPGMAQRGRGRVVFVSSIAGAVGVAGEAVYAATKAGLAMFAESLAYETRGQGVGVSVVVPGVIVLRPAGAALRAPLARAGGPAPGGRRSGLRGGTRGQRGLCAGVAACPRLAAWGCPWGVPRRVGPFWRVVVSAGWRRW
jgi:NAD(P)-dependent dehydrogenase (short-subunit alcohol dehydrogenase family)